MSLRTTSRRTTSRRRIVALLLVALLSTGIAGSTFAAMPHATGPGMAPFVWLSGLMQGGVDWLEGWFGSPGGGPVDALGFDLEPGG